jgi:CRISPR-associated protein Csm2
MANTSRFSGSDHSSRSNSNRNDFVNPELQTFLKKINLAKPEPDMFDEIAENIANILKQGSRDKNKSSQIRRFYDELLRYKSHAQGDEEKFNQMLPFIRMLNARAAYAKSRNHVDENFTVFLRALLEQVRDTSTLENACTTFEAVIGFSPK